MTSLTLWWTQNEIPPNLWPSIYGRVSFALQMLQAAADVAAAWWNAAIDTRAAMKRSDPFLLFSLEKQRYYLYSAAMAQQLILQSALSGTSLITVLSRNPVSSKWYYGDKNQQGVIRWIQQPYNPFWIVNTNGTYSMFVPGSGTRNPTLVTPSGRIFVLGPAPGTPGDNDRSKIVTFANIHPLAFVDHSGNVEPPGTATDGIFDPSTGQMVMTTEDAVQAVVAKLLDFASYIRANLVPEREGWEKVYHPGEYANLPPLPAPPPTILAAEQTSAPPAPEPGTLPPNPVPTTALLPVAVKDDNPPTPTTDTTSGPSGWQVAGAIGLAGVVGYGAWKITGAMMPPRARGMIANPSVSIPTPYATEVTEVGKKVFRDGSVEYWYRVKNGMTMGYQSSVKASKSSPQHASNIRAKFRYQLRNAANVREAEQLVRKLDEQLPS